MENYLLYRAAELTTQNEYDFFQLVERDTDKTTNYYNNGPTVGVFGGRRHGNVGWTLGTNDDFFETEHRFTAVANILLGRGEKPRDNPSAYDAEAVLANLQPTIIHPKN